MEKPSLLQGEKTSHSGSSFEGSQVIVPILGMHRCGTSMLTHMLSIMGVELGEPLQSPGFDNPSGFWENRFFQAVNIELLKWAGCNTDGFDRSKTLKRTSRFLGKTPSPKIITNSVLQYINLSFQNTHWGWKDPRTVITWPFWKRCLNHLGYIDIRPIVLVRHPDSCIASLKKRGDFNWQVLPEGLPMEHYIACLWKCYYELIEIYLSEKSLIMLQEDLLDNDKAAFEMKRCAKYLELEEIGIGPALATIDVRLISHKKKVLADVRDSEAGTIYETLVDRAERQREAFVLRQPGGAAWTTTLEADRKRDRFCIYVASPERYIHSRAFDEHALSLHYAFHELGYVVPIVRYPWEISGTPIVLGANLLPHITGVDLPPDSILYNLEQILEGSPWLGAGYIDVLRRYQVWDYSPQNIDNLIELGIENALLCRIGYVPEMSYITELPDDEQHVDVLFYGSENSRRSSILDQLKKKGVKVESFFGVYGMRRDRLIARAKIVINIHFYESKVMEIIRLSHLMANKKFIVSERGNDQIIERPFEAGIVFVDYDSLVERCLYYLQNPSERKSIAAMGFEIFSANKQADFLKAALSRSGLPL